MKKLLALVLSLLMLLSVLAACTDKPGTTTDAPASSSGEPSTEQSAQSPATSPSPSAPADNSSVPPSESKEPEREPLPSAVTLRGTKHLPVVDSQGSIGCCTSQGVTYTQFTVAVSQYINSKDPNSDWDPSSGNTSYIFSPKFTYNYSGSGTDICYQVLRDNGCLPMSMSVFDKTPQAADGTWGGSILNSQKSRAWDITSGEYMLAALNYRITNYEEIEYSATHSGQLTTDEAGQDLLYKIKDALNRGNAVSVCGWSSYWQYATIDPKGTGTLGKKGDGIIWNGYKDLDSTSDGNHCVAIVGYDDEVTYTRAGVTMKGAFLIMNSWGSGYQDGGFCWMAYDACNKISEFDIFNDSDFYNNCIALSPTTLKGVSPLKSVGAVEFTFTPVGEQEIDGKTCTVYTLGDGEGKYLSYAGGTVSMVSAADENCNFALVEGKGSGDYAKASLLYAVGAGKYLSFTGTGAGSKTELTESLTKKAQVFFSINTSEKNEDGSFVDMINTVSTSAKYERTGTLYRFSFIYWDEDIAVGPSKLSVEVQVSALDRNTLYMTLNRTDKNGVQDSFAAASMELRYKHNTIPETAEIKEGETLSFSGIINPTEREEGYFVFTYDPLLGISSDFDYTDFLWGVTVRGSGVIIKQLRLIDEQGKELFCVKPDAQAGELVKGEVHSFLFNAGEELDSYFGTGTYRLKNVGTGKTLSLASSNMLFSWFDGKKANEEKTAFSIQYDKATDSYTFKNFKDNVFDIFKTTVEDGVLVKMNAVNPARDTQTWTVTRTEDGYLRISLKNYPEYAFGYSKDFCISKTDKSDNFLWELEAIETAEINLDVKQADGKVSVAATAHKEYESGAMQVKIVKDGAVVTTLEGTPEKNTFTVETTLEAGTYLFTLMYNGEEVGTQVIYTVK